MSRHPQSSAKESVPASLIRLLDERFGLAALWVFGSEAAGRARPDSDLDLAALFRRHPSPVELFEAKSDAVAEIGRAIDLVDLDEASPILAMQALRHGHLLVDGDPARRIRFTAGLTGRYEDLKRVRRPIEEALVRRMTDGRA